MKDTRGIRGLRRNKRYKRNQRMKKKKIRSRVLEKISSRHGTRDLPWKYSE